MQAGLRDWALRDPERIAIMLDALPAGAPASQVTYAALEGLANSYANFLADAGIARAEHIAMLLGNSVDAVALCWGAYRSGVYLTPLPTTLGPVETAYIIANATARLVIVDAGYTQAHPLPGLCPDVRFHAMNGAPEGFAALEPMLDQMPKTPRPGETPGGLMMYSSGTTGAPKGILRPLPEQANGLPPFARDLAGLFGLTAETRYLSTQPLYHAAALRFVLAMTATGALSVVMAKFEAARALQLIDAHNLTLSQWVPTMFRRLLALPHSARSAFAGVSHNRAIHGSAPCTPALKRAMLDWWGPIIEEYYSGSEGVGLTLINASEWQARPGSVGRAIKGAVHILGPDDSELAPGQTGRVFFSGVPLFQYFNDPDKTAGKTSAQGWQSFGDIGHLDADGYLFLSDRLDDMIISGGVNLYPQEIEAAIEEAPFVAACGVIGVPDADFDERPVAFVVPKPGEPDILPRLKTHIETRLGRIKQPREIHLVADLPYSDPGKLLRRALREMLPKP